MNLVVEDLEDIELNNSPLNNESTAIDINYDASDEESDDDQGKLIYQKEENPDTTCLICMEDNFDNDTLLVSSNNCDCKRFYHINCFFNWFEVETECPICHKKLCENGISLFIYNKQLNDWEEISLASLYSLLDRCTDNTVFKFKEARIKKELKKDMEKEIRIRVRNGVQMELERNFNTHELLEQSNYDCYRTFICIILVFIIMAIIYFIYTYII